MLINTVLNYLYSNSTDIDGKYVMCKGGRDTLYSSCFVVMCLHYLGSLDKVSVEKKMNWIDYIKSWQSEVGGLFVGPEIVKSELTSPNHDYEHVTMHLTAHVLPALTLLGANPNYPLTFAHPFLDSEYLLDWLNHRDWTNAWLEGNNLLFIGQFLVFLRDIEAKPNAQKALDIYFNWLDLQIDPDTGLWGTDGHCSPFVAMCGGYHQLLVYYYENRPVLYKERLIDTVLSLQHDDGGFAPSGGGGACEDVDAVDILVNMYKQIDYRRVEIRIALRRCLRHILRLQNPDGGFPYKANAPFIHMGIKATASPMGVSNMFGTWFRLHTIALIAEILTDEHVLEDYNFNFNADLSMGWHKRWDKMQHQLSLKDRRNERVMSAKIMLQGYIHEAKTLYGRAINKVNRIYGQK